MHTRPVSKGSAWLIYLLVLLVVGAITFWAGLTVGKKNTAPQQETDQEVFVTVTQQTLGRSFTLGATVTQERSAVAENLLTGVLTGAASEGLVSTGEVVYSVDGTAVKAVVSSRPFYRDLFEGTSGDDVRALNDALVELGYLDEGGEKFDGWTTYAVQLWQRDQGVEATGTIQRGELLAVLALPGTLIVDTTQFPIGSIVSEGENLVLQRAAEPRFTIPVTQTQAQMVPLGAPVSVQFRQFTWGAEVVGTEKDINGDLNLMLSGPDGAPVCGDQCGELPSDESLTLLASIQVVPETTGPAVPIAALRIEPNGEVQVLVRQGADAQSGPSEARQVAPRSVTVLASQDGVAIINGVEVGEEVQLFGSKQADVGTGTGLKVETDEDGAEQSDSKSQS
ncbi:peptidoglycan-binding domain-containing protein [Actinomyces minihominis]|uniref:peptidoglycan-binding domain-containing protein n=1 Tax=Actinomyces minihominis TaxID=2002838 RepID=UPI000C06D832|nr:peptidoglycan-binding domain-containing protein [Actinomyces minihominis]